MEKQHHVMQKCVLCEWLLVQHDKQNRSRMETNSGGEFGEGGVDRLRPTACMDWNGAALTLMPL